MKNLKIIFIMLSLLLISTVFVLPDVAKAAGPSIIVTGQVTSNGAPVDGASVYLTEPSGAYLFDTSGPTGASGLPGSYLFDMSNLPIQPSDGDFITVTASFGSRGVTSEFTYSSTAGSVVIPTIDIPPTPVCQTGADTNLDGLISMAELLVYIGQWKTGSVTMQLLLQAVGFWKTGTGC